MGFRRGEKKNGNRNFLLPSLEVEGTITLSNQINTYLAKIDNLKYLEIKL